MQLQLSARIVRPSHTLIAIAIALESNTLMYRVDQRNNRTRKNFSIASLNPEIRKMSVADIFSMVLNQKTSLDYKHYMINVSCAGKGLFSVIEHVCPLCDLNQTGSVQNPETGYGSPEK
ncbi:hypothetical protein DINM_004758 [Dirofilaria immitis]|nr:hypothetical protein [Dirofilaria immitis]